MSRATPSPPKSYADTVHGLRGGFGAEDIALRHGLPFELIRAHIAEMRRRGVLAGIVRYGAEG